MGDFIRDGYEHTWLGRILLTCALGVLLIGVLFLAPFLWVWEKVKK